MGRKMVINCSLCDTRKVREETLAEFEHITINGSLILVSPESKVLLDKYPVTMNCADVKELGDDVQFSTVNGVSQIKSTDTVTGKRYLIVNGTVEIGPGTEKVLESYIGISVNGTATYPESISAHLGMMKVNGSTTCYPDGAIVLKRNAVIDRLFALRAKNSLYWSAKRMIMVDPALDPAKLEAKGASFSTGEVILAEALVEDMIGMIDERAEIIIVPDGTEVVLDDVELDDSVPKKGNKLYIIGDLKVTGEGKKSLKALEYLNVRGDVCVIEDLKEDLLAVPGEIKGSVKVIKKSKGRTISDQMNVTVSKWMLEQSADGLHIEDVMTVKIGEDVPKELILERLTICDVMTVVCSDDQKDALTVVSDDVMTIGSGEDDEAAKGICDMVKESVGAAMDVLNTKVVNCSEYVM